MPAGSRGSHSSASATAAGLSGTTARRLAAAGRLAARRGTATTLEETLQAAEQLATVTTAARIAASGLAATAGLSSTARRLSSAAAGLSGTAGRLAARRSTAAVTVEQALQPAEQLAAVAAARIAAGRLSAARGLAAAGRLAAIGRTATAATTEEAEAESVGAGSARRQQGDRTQGGRSKTQVHERFLHETGGGGNHALPSSAFDRVEGAGLSRAPQLPGDPADDVRLVCLHSDIDYGFGALCPARRFRPAFLDRTAACNGCDDGADARRVRCADRGKDPPQRRRAPHD